MSNPTTLVSRFNGSLAFSGTGGAGVWTGVDPIRYDSGLYLEEGTTNYVTNPSFETDLTDWFQDPGSLLERVASSLVDGAWTSRWTFDGVTAYPSGHYTAPVAATPSSGAHTSVVSGSVWGSGGQSMGLYTNIWTADYTVRRLNQVFFTPSATPDRVFATVSSEAGDADIDQFDIILGEINTGNPNSNVCHLDAVQMEIGSRAYPTSFCRSDMGDGYSLGANGIHVRAASSASTPTATRLSPSTGSIAFRATPTIETGVEEIWGQAGTKGAGTDQVRWGRDSTKHPFVEWSSNDAAYVRETATETVDAGDEHFFFIGHQGLLMLMIVDEGASNASARSAVQGSFGAGDLTLLASAGGVVVNQFATFNRVLTPAEIAKLEGSQNWSINMLGGSKIVVPLSARRRRR